MNHEKKVKRWREKLSKLYSQERIKSALNVSNSKRHRTVRLHKEGCPEVQIQYKICDSWFTKSRRLQKQLEKEYDLDGLTELNPVANSACVYAEINGVEGSRILKLMDGFDTGSIYYEVDSPSHYFSALLERDSFH